MGDNQSTRALARLPGRVIALLDACHAGTAAGERLTDDLVRDLVTDDYGVIVMASSMSRRRTMRTAGARPLWR